MAMGRRKDVQDVQGELLICPAELPDGGGHVFFEKLNQLLGQHEFDRKVEALCGLFVSFVRMVSREWVFVAPCSGLAFWAVLHLAVLKLIGIHVAKTEYSQTMAPVLLTWVLLPI